MPKTRDQLLDFLCDHGLAYQLHEHDAVFTVEESKHLRGTIQGGHSKNLFLKDKKGRLFIVVAEESAEIDLKTIHTVIGAQGRVSFGKAELLEEVWGVRPGSVTPLGAINDTDGRVTVVLDEAMLRHDQLNFHPLVNTATITISKDHLVAFLQAVDHDPLVLSVSRSEAQ